MKRLLLLAALLFTATLAAQAEASGLGPLGIDHPHVIAGSAKALSVAGYLTLINKGVEADMLVSITSPVATVTLHESTVDADGVARMQRLDAVNLPPGASVIFEPGGLHLMFTDLSGTLQIADKVPATLRFEKAGSIDVMFTVEGRGAASHDHGGTSGG